MSAKADVLKDGASKECVSVTVDVSRTVVTAKRCELRTLRATLHKSAVSESHTLASPAEPPTRAPTLASLPPNADPRTVMRTLVLRAVFAGDVPSGSDRSYETPSVAVPGSIPAVTAILREPPTALASKHAKAVSLTHTVPSAPVPPTWLRVQGLGFRVEVSGMKV